MYEYCSLHDFCHARRFQTQQSVDDRKRMDDYCPGTIGHRKIIFFPVQNLPDLVDCLEIYRQVVGILLELSV